MNSITKSLVVVTTVLGLGTSTLATANENSIQQALSKTVIAQGQQVTANLAKQLQRSISIELNKFALANSSVSIKVKDIALENNNQITKTTTAEEE